MTIKRFAFIESNTTGTGEVFLHKAIEKGYEVLFLTSAPERYQFLNKSMIIPVKIDTSDRDEVLLYLSSIEFLEGVFSSSEYFIEISSYVANKLGLPCNNTESIINCRNKDILAAILKAAQVLTPKSFLITCERDLKKIADEIIFPVVIKPTLGSGSIGVKLCKNIVEYEEHTKFLLSIKENERGKTLESRILVQEYISGNEFSVEVIKTNESIEIIGITQKYLGSEPYFLEIGHDFPAILDQKIEEKIRKTAISALIAMNYKLGAAHIELRVLNNDVYIIEINPRLAGGMIPALINEALGIDVIDLLLDLHCGKSIEIVSKQKKYSSIRFLIPENAGKIKKIEKSDSDSKLKMLSITKSVGDKVTKHGDFRDRIGFLISSDCSIEKAREIVSEEIKKIKIHIDTEGEELDSLKKTGRLSSTLNVEALDIISRDQNNEKLNHELSLLTTIDEAHLLMLVNQNIILQSYAKVILSEIQSQKKNQFIEFKDQERPRGTYLLYESVLIQKLGMDVAGIIHTGRSRNDINSTLFKLSIRESYKNIFQKIWQLRMSLLQKAECFLNIEMPIYSQFQPALPGSYAYYLIAIEEAFAKEVCNFKSFYEELSECPLGAGAGGGTSFPIDPNLTASLLGFTHSFRNALEAVSSRDLALRLLSSLSIFGTIISRVSQDFQIWTTQEFSFFNLPDELCGGSSMLPQKKNPYLLEKIKGKSLLPTGQLMFSLASMQKTPFSNSVEVGTEALSDFSKSFTAVLDAVTLLNLIINHAEPQINNMKNSNEKGLTKATYVAESLVKMGIPFREAHYRVGDIISEAINKKLDPLKAIYNLLPSKSNLNEFSYGGGSSIDSTSKQLKDSINRLKKDGIWMQKIISFWLKSNKLRESKIEELIN